MWSVISHFAAVLLLGALSNANEDEVVTGRLFNKPCSSFNVSAVAPLNLTLLNGDWYLYATFDKGLPLHHYKCIKFNRQTGQKNNTMETREVAENRATNKQIVKHSVLVFENPEVGKYTYDVDNISEPTLIIATNYVNYYIEFHCEDKKGGRQSNCYLGIFKRRTTPTDEALKTFNKFLDDHKFNRAILRKVKQGSGCKY